MKARNKMVSLQEIKDKRLNVYFIGGIRYEIPLQVEQAFENEIESKDKQIKELRSLMAWKPYPEYAPEKDGWYLVSQTTGMGSAVFRAHYDGHDWSDHYGIYTKSPDAYCVLPAPYQPPKSKEG